MEVDPSTSNSVSVPGTFNVSSNTTAAINGGSVSDESDDEHGATTTKKTTNTGGQPKQRQRLLGSHHHLQQKSTEAAANDEELVYESSGDESIGDEEMVVQQDEQDSTEAAQSAFAANDSNLNPNLNVWQRGVDPLDPHTEQLEYDQTAYTMLHRLQLEWPSLSFDILGDHLGLLREKFPHTMYVVTGSQAEQSNQNVITVMKVDSLGKTLQKDDEDEMSDSDDEDDSDGEDDLDVYVDPVLRERSIQHFGSVNRIRVQRHVPDSNVVASWSDTGKVHIYDLTKQRNELETIPPQQSSTAIKSKKPQQYPKVEPLHTFKASTEGFAMDWSKHGSVLVVGDCQSHITTLTQKDNSTKYVNSSKPFTGHSGSIEDLQWSPAESTVFASASTDKTIRIWDTRQPQACGAFVVAHRTDVNVISWNQTVQHLLASGGDDGSMKVWDLRKFVSSSPAANFHWHKDAITSIEWHPSDESVLACTSADDQLSIWDMALECDPEEQRELGIGASVPDNLPSQLFFVHQGQHHMKELHWSTQVNHALISTAEDGFNFFIAANMEQTV